jgi:orotidine-5'-phosphate decarboxylase
MEARDRLIVALDVSDAAQARAIAGQVGEAAGFFKVGKQLFTAEGPQVVRDLVASRRRVFLDLKFHDIPTTVAGAVAAASQLGVGMVTVHAAGGSRMLKAALDSAGPTGPMILAVTVLTSLTDADMTEIGIGGLVRDQALRMAFLARRCGCPGIVVSPHEAAEIRRDLGSGFAIVTPGIRPAGSPAGDQSRIATPADAIRAGATHLVVGRPITAAHDPAAAARSVLAEIDQACRQPVTA